MNNRNWQAQVQIQSPNKVLKVKSKLSGTHVLQNPPQNYPTPQEVQIV